MKKIEKSINIGGRKLTLTTGHMAQQASGAVVASCGETVVLAAVVASPLKEELGYFPLTINYMEKLYAGGRIKGSRWVKREGRPLDDEILTGRLIDRSIRPLFIKGYKKDVQVTITVLSVDLENSPDLVAAYATSAAVAISSIPWNGPVSVVKVGRKDGKLITNPLESQLQESQLELIVSSVKDSIVMIESGAYEVNEKEMSEAIAHAQKEGAKITKLINDFAKDCKVKKEVFKPEKKNADIERRVKKLAGDKLKELITNLATKKATYGDYDEVKTTVSESFDEGEKKQAKAVFDELFTNNIKKLLLSGKRPDGRKPDEIRELSTEVGVLPRTHGSAIFNRGQTQVLSIATLGAPSLEQTIESAEGEETKRYMHHYYMPPFSVGETGRVGFPSRREIGHGALAEKALLPVIPDEETFPYAIRVVSEVLSSNGSTSLASACGATLSLMDAGVPIKAPVAGIAMGLVIEDEKKFEILTDITGLEDGNGDMDFKVAGTDKGITALQLDVKTLKLTLPILTSALSQAIKAKSEILKAMSKTISESRKRVSDHAPKIKALKVPQDKIGDIIGPGGRMIKSIISETGAQVDVEDDGTVNISADLQKEVNAAVEKIEALVKEFKAGEIYEGEVKRIESFGVFVEVLPGREGMVHISDMSEDFVQDPREIVKIGDKTKVRVKEIDDLGRVNLSMVLKPGKERKHIRSQKGNRGKRDDGSSRYVPRRRSFRQNDRKKRGRSSGPHFPTSRLLDQKEKNFSR